MNGPVGSLSSFRSNPGFSLPYLITCTIEGVADLLFHRWNPESIEEKASAKKNSRAKRFDDLEAYVYRAEDGELALPGEYVRGAVVAAARYIQDPRSPRKSAMDLYKAGVVCLTALSPLGTRAWDYEDRRRVVIQRAGVNRIRPAMRRGWRASFVFQINTPEYIDPTDFRQTLDMAGRLIGVGDFRPTFGRFMLASSDVQQDFDLAA